MNAPSIATNAVAADTCSANSIMAGTQTHPAAQVNANNPKGSVDPSRSGLAGLIQ
jgi:hypothetical protein